MSRGKTVGKDDPAAGAPDDAALERCVREAMEAAGIQGLCREGQLEAAVDAVRALRPGWPATTALAAVQRVVAARDAPARKRP